MVSFLIFEAIIDSQVSVFAITLTCLPSVGQIIDSVKLRGYNFSGFWQNQLMSLKVSTIWILRLVTVLQSWRRWSILQDFLICLPLLALQTSLSSTSSTSHWYFWNWDFFVSFISCLIGPFMPSYWSNSSPNFAWITSFRSLLSCFMDGMAASILLVVLHQPQILVDLHCWGTIVYLAGLH